MNFCPGSKIHLMEKLQDMTELSTNYVTFAIFEIRLSNLLARKLQN
jgi:hypothetical protein